MARRMSFYEVYCLLIEEGKTLEEVGRILGVSRQAVWEYCKKHGINLKQREASWYAKYYGVPELAERTWLLNQKRESRKLSLRALAKKLGISESCLVKQIKRLGLDPQDFAYQGKTTIFVHCSNCGRLLQRDEKYLRRYKHFFCNKKCQGQWLGKLPKRKVWTPREKHFVLENYQKMTDREMAQHLGRSEDGVRRYRKEILGLSKKRAWTLEEKEFILENYQKMTDREMAQHLGRSEIGVLHKRLEALGLSKTKKKSWTLEEKQFILESYQKMTDREMAQYLRRSEVGVRHYRQRKLALLKRSKIK